MCVIIVKEAGVKLPSQDTLQTCWVNNSDGAGFAYTHKGNVYIRKGFMTFDDLLDALAALTIDTTDVPMILHFRITTHGGTKPENCHPFPVSGNVAMLTKPVMRCDLAVAHNGIIDITPRENISDTMEYIVRQLSHLKKANKKFYDNPHLMRLIEEAIESKMAFLTHEGKIRTIGEFVEHEGCMFSNTSYLPRLYNFADYTGTDLLGDDEGFKLLGYTPCSEYSIIEDGIEYVDFYNIYVDKHGFVYMYDFETNVAYELPSAAAIDKKSGKIAKLYDIDPKDWEFIEVVPCGEHEEENNVL